MGNVKFSVPGSSWRYVSPAALFPLGYLSALVEVGSKKATGLLTRTLDNIAEELHVARSPELKELKGLAGKAGGRLRAYRDGPVRVEVPYLLPKDPNAHIKAQKDLYAGIQEIMRQTGHQLRTTSDGILPFCLYANGIDGYIISGVVPNFETNPIRSARSGLPFNNIADVTIGHDRVTLTADEEAGSVLRAFAKVLPYISRPDKIADVCRA